MNRRGFLTTAEGKFWLPRLLQGRSGTAATTSTWSPGRQRLAALAVLVATLTGAVGTVLDGSSSYVYGGGAYVMIAALALFFPAAITAQVIGGQVLVGSLLMGQEGFAALILVPALAGVVATAELLAIVAWLDTPLQRDPRDALPKAGLAAVIGGGVFGAVMLVSGLPGPGGLVAVGLASGACVVLATRLMRSAG